MAAHGHVRATKDLDVWVRPDLDNAARVLGALSAFGAPLHDLTVEDLATPGTIFQIGVAPIRIDVITSIDGVAFPDAWKARIQAPFADQVVPILSREDLITNKRAAGREQESPPVGFACLWRLQLNADTLGGLKTWLMTSD